MKKFMDYLCAGTCIACLSYGAYKLYTDTKEKREKFGKELENELSKAFEAMERRFEEGCDNCGNSDQGKAG